jgi:predicted nucleic-acid-binding protein
VIGFDTNILVRYLVEDDPEQTRLADRLIDSLTSANPGWIGLTALAETVWVLTRTYRLNRRRIVPILESLLVSREIVIEQSEMVREALRLYLSGKADFPDCLIALSARAAGCSRTVTFDRRAARDAGMELLA